MKGDVYMDLDNFPNCKASQRMLSRISPIYGESYVVKWLMEAMGIEIQEARDLYEELRLQIVPQTATWGLDYWEQRYYIPIDHSMSLEERRKRIFLRQAMRAPMNPERIKQLAETIVDIPVDVQEHIAPYVFGLFFDYPAAKPLDLIKLLQTIRRAKPSHLSLFFRIVIQANPCKAWIASYSASMLCASIAPVKQKPVLQKNRLNIGFYSSNRIESIIGPRRAAQVKTPLKSILYCTMSGITSVAVAVNVKYPSGARVKLFSTYTILGTQAVIIRPFLNKGGMLPNE